MKICYLVLMFVAFFVSATVWSTFVHAADRKKTNTTVAKRVTAKPARTMGVAAANSIPVGQANPQSYNAPGMICYLPGANGNTWGLAAGAGNDPGRYPSAAPMQSPTVQTPQTGSVAAQPTCFYYPNTVYYNPTTQCWTRWGVPAATGSSVSSQPVHPGTQDSTWNQPAQGANAASGNNAIYCSACVPAWNAWY
jgi:hypothetical protein